MNILWVRWFATDYTSSTRGLTLLQHGAYIQLLNEIFCTQKSLPPDTEEIFRICKAVTKDEMDAVQFILKRKFVFSDDGWTHKRAFSEVARSIDISGKRSTAGKRGREAQLGVCPAIAQPLLGRIDIEVDKKEQIPLSEDEPPVSVPNLDVNGVWDYFLEMTERNPNKNTFTKTRQKQLARRFNERIKANDGNTTKAKADIRAAIDSLANSDFHMARGEHKGQKKFNEWERIFFSQEKFEKWLEQEEE